jgi:AcrR family transcriptional regulator
MPRHQTDETRQRIERAAIQLFVEKGVAATTVRDIAGAVGLSEGAMYRHFVSKDELVWLIFERHYIEFAGRLGALAAAESSTRAKLGAMIRGFCQSHDEDAILFRFLLFVQHGQLARLADGTPTPVSVMRAVLESGIASGDIPAQNPDLATALVFGLVLEPVQFAAYGRLSADMNAMSERLIAAAWAAITTV